MPFVDEGIAVRQVSDDQWRLLDDLVYLGNREVFEVPAGFETDLASVPRALWWLIPRYGRYTRAAILHDHLWERARNGTFSRVDADGIFRRSMRELGVPFLRRWVMWAAVRFGSGWSSFWAGGTRQALLAIGWGLLASVFLLVPAVVVLVWLTVVWLLERALCPILDRTTPDDEQVNRPQLLGPR